MTRDDIIRLAREARKETQTIIASKSRPVFVSPFIERLAVLIAAAEREACAKVCDSRVMGDNNREDEEAKRCAAAIRARGEQEKPR